MLKFTYMILLIPTLVFAITFLIDVMIFIYFPQKKNTARLLAAISVCLLFFVASSFTFLQLSIFSITFATINVFRAINSARVFASRLNPKEVISRFTKSAVWFAGLSSILLMLSITEPNWNVLLIVSWLGLLTSIILLINTVVSLNKWSTVRRRSISEKKLPTVSICIPARNETQDLPQCIESMLGSTYPKLEIIVLDDCSHDKTPAVIKDFAHKGVRFISGEEPDKNWLAKNKAMNKLFEESTGEIVIFTGVDVRFSPESVQEIVQSLENGLEMMSILPFRRDNHETSVFIQPLRYWWELAVPRIIGGRPPALSTCWAIRKDTLIKIGDFESVRRSVQPEAHFAKRLKDAYRFVISGKVLGVTSAKKPREQYDTALRIRYPQAGRKPEKVLILLLIELFVFTTPILGLYYAITDGSSYQLILSSSALGVLVSLNIIISMLTVKKIWLVGLITLPFLVIEEWYLLIRSMLAYEFGVVRWKDRNICLPMLSVEKELPKI